MYSDKKETSESTSPPPDSAAGGAADTKTPPPRLFGQLSGLSKSGRTVIKLEEIDNQPNEEKSTGAVESESM